MSRSDVRSDREGWRSAPRDPDPADLGYDITDWEVIRARKDGGGHLMFLPEDEDRLREEAFIVAESGAVCNVEDRL